MKDRRKSKTQFLEELQPPRDRRAAPGWTEGRRTTVAKTPDLSAEFPVGTETILLVDDVTRVRAHVREVLRLAGYKVLEAASSEEALRVCESDVGPIHLLLTDVVLPGISGRLLGDLVALVSPKTKALYMSGHSDEVLRHQGFQKSGTAFLHKPFTPQALTQAVRKVLTT